MNRILSIKEETIIKIAIEAWRLSKLKPQNAKDKITISKFLKQLQALFIEASVELIDLTEQEHEHDPGLAVEIVYTENANEATFKKEIISEMISPIVLINGKVAKHGQVVTKKIV
jgi:hypothetical protein